MALPPRVWLLGLRAVSRMLGPDQPIPVPRTGAGGAEPLDTPGIEDGFQGFILLPTLRPGDKGAIGLAT